MKHANDNRSRNLCGATTRHEFWVAHNLQTAKANAHRSTAEGRRQRAEGGSRALLCAVYRSRHGQRVVQISFQFVQLRNTTASAHSSSSNNNNVKQTALLRNLHQAKLTTSFDAPRNKIVHAWFSSISANNFATEEHARPLARRTARRTQSIRRPTFGPINAQSQLHSRSETRGSIIGDLHQTAARANVGFAYLVRSMHDCRATDSIRPVTAYVSKRQTDCNSNPHARAKRFESVCKSSSAQHIVCLLSFETKIQRTFRIRRNAVMFALTK